MFILIFSFADRLRIGSTHPTDFQEAAHNELNSCRSRRGRCALSVQKTGSKLKPIIDKSPPTIKLVLSGINHARRRVKQLSSMYFFLAKMRTVLFESRPAALKECLIGIYTLLYKASLSELTLSHGVCQLGMQPNQVWCPEWNAKKTTMGVCKKRALTILCDWHCAFREELPKPSQLRFSVAKRFDRHGALRSRDSNKSCINIREGI